MCYLDATTRHVRSAAAVEEHLPTTSGSEKAALQFRIDGSGFNFVSGSGSRQAKKVLKRAGD